MEPAGIFFFLFVWYSFEYFSITVPKNQLDNISQICHKFYELPVPLSTCRLVTYVVPSYRPIVIVIFDSRRMN